MGALISKLDTPSAGLIIVSGFAYGGAHVPDPSLQRNNKHLSLWLADSANTVIASEAKRSRRRLAPSGPWIAASLRSSQ